MALIELAVPADPDYVGLIKSAAAHIAAHADFTLEAIDDLRLAVDEAFAVLIAHQPETGRVAVTFHVHDDSLIIEMTGPAGSPKPDKNSFAWTVLTALVHEVKAQTSSDGLVTLLLTAKVVASA
ncbi:MAG: ATP-binding protein [Candidatus Nanopelagicales bacterium]|nr:ATP-binding protein [Candidatus Nanopelagicales bacterium]MDP4667058.1 ATP-binding protein [Candidatus Nanopelagicales bacterium]MDP4895972.1 ATP-binding protein [Candidatus Nanopelagicales bacterium]MDP5050730.1 ATP-binding protein [Candidatus Nanopelagicales bacterium]